MGWVWVPRRTRNSSTVECVPLNICRHDCCRLLGVSLSSTGFSSTNEFYVVSRTRHDPLFVQVRTRPKLLKETISDVEHGFVPSVSSSYHVFPAHSDRITDASKYNTGGILLMALGILRNLVSH